MAPKYGALGVEASTPAAASRPRGSGDRFSLLKYGVFTGALLFVAVTTTTRFFPGASSPSATDLLGSATTGSISKNTWTASDPVAVADWMLEFLPVMSWIVGNVTDTNTSDCATYGKVVVGNFSHSTAHSFFQLHSVSAPDRPSGELEVADVEAGFVAALGDLSEVTSSGKWPVWLDFNTGLYTSDLDFYVNAFVQVGACTLCSLAVLTLAQLHRE